MKNKNTLWFTLWLTKDFDGHVDIWSEKPKRNKKLKIWQPNKAQTYSMPAHSIYNVSLVFGMDIFREVADNATDLTWIDEPKKITVGFNMEIIPEPLSAKTCDECEGVGKK